MQDSEFKKNKEFVKSVKHKKSKVLKNTQKMAEDALNRMRMKGKKHSRLGETQRKPGEQTCSSLLNIRDTSIDSPVDEESGRHKRPAWSVEQRVAASLSRRYYEIKKLKAAVHKMTEIAAVMVV